MKPIEVKTFLWENGLSISAMAREIAKDGTATERSLHTMISDMIYQRKFYPTLAKKLKEKFGLELERVEHLQPVQRLLQKTT